MTLPRKPPIALDANSQTISTMRTSIWVESMLKYAFWMVSFTLRIWNQQMGTFYQYHRTWMRLSKSYDQSGSWLLGHETIFKVGSVSTFICKYRSEEKVKKISNLESDCGKCDRKKDCFFLPCRHNIICWECAEELEQCLVCGCIIQERIKIFIWRILFSSLSYSVNIIPIIIAYDFVCCE